MYDFVVRYIRKNGKPVNLDNVQASTITGAKRKASNRVPENKGKWQLANGYTWEKEGETGTLYLLIPHDLVIRRPLPTEKRK